MDKDSPDKPDSNFQSADTLARRNKIQEAYRSHPVPWFRWVFDQIPLPPSARLLELGCGTGQIWSANRERIGPGWRITLTDFSVGMLTDTRGSIREFSQAFNLCAASAQAIPCSDEVFDVVLAVGVLDLLPDLAAGLVEIRRALKPGGLLAASAGGKRHLFEMKELLSPYVEDVDLGGQGDRLGFENGRQRLLYVFSHVDQIEYLDTLQFTEAGPVIDYLLSESAVRRELTEEKISALIQQVKRRLTGGGKMQVTVQKGLFLASKQGC